MNVIERRISEPSLVGAQVRGRTGRRHISKLSVTSQICGDLPPVGTLVRSLEISEEQQMYNPTVPDFTIRQAWRYP